MIVKAFFSNKSSLLFCLENLKEQVSKCFDSYDFLFFSIYPEYTFYNVNSLIRKIFKTENFIAFNSSNIFIDDEIKIKGVGLFVIKFENKGKISTFINKGCYVGNLEKVSNYLNENRDKFHLIISNLERTDHFVEEISHKLNYFPVNNIAGGVIAGVNVNGEERKYIFYDNSILKQGFVIVSFENVEWKIGISSGFMPYGITYKILKANDKRIYFVDDGKHFGYIFKKLLNGIENPDIRYTWYTPIYVLNEERGYISSVRTVKNITDEYVEFYASVKEGEFFKLSFATKEELIEEDKKVANRLIEKLKNPEIIFNFSCLARQYVLEDKQEEEIKTYTNVFNAHLFGFFTAGEIAPNVKNYRLMFYNETSIPVILKEK